MAKVDLSDTARVVSGIVERIVSAINADANCWQAEYKLARVKHEWSKWIATDPDTDEAIGVTSKLNEVYGVNDGPFLSIVEWREESEQRRQELIDSQGQLCDQIEQAKASLESATERAKAAKAEIEECHSRLRGVARDLKRPLIYGLPSPPDRQRSLLVDDGEEWRLVKLSKVLEEDIALRAVAENKLGDVTLGEYAEQAAKFGVGDKPKRLTRKQWDAIEERVQEWHANNGKDDDASTEASV